MSVRTTAKLGLVTVAVTGLVFTALVPANADTVPGQNDVPGTYSPGTSIVGVGSDTIQWVDDQLAQDYDSQTPTPSPAWANFSACLGNTSAGAQGCFSATA